MSTTQAAPSARKQLDGFIARFSPAIAKRARAALAVMRKRLPGAFELVYDNAYALVVGFGPSERASAALFSVVIHPKRIGLCFLYGVDVPDPEGLLQGNGNQVRHIRIEDEKTLAKRSVRALINAAIEVAGNPYDGIGPGRTILRAVSVKRRPRRPS